MVIKYSNWNDETLTFQQAQQLSEYIKVTSHHITGLTKQIDYIERDILQDIEYYLDLGENENEVLSFLSTLVKNSVIIVTRQQEGNYYLELRREYKSQQLKFETDYLRDKYNNIICERDKDLITGLPILETTIKYHYDYEDYTEGSGYRIIFEAEYEADGSLSVLTYMPSDNEQDYMYFDSGGFSSLQAMFSTEDISYYKTAALLPNGV